MLTVIISSTEGDTISTEEMQHLYDFKLVDVRVAHV